MAPAPRTLMLLTVLAAAFMAGNSAAKARGAASVPFAVVADAPTGTGISGSISAKRDGGACSEDSDCESGECEGGSCCTPHGATCDSSSHCCGHQSCGKDGTCP